MIDQKLLVRPWEKSEVFEPWQATINMTAFFQIGPKTCRSSKFYRKRKYGKKMELQTTS